MDTILTEQIQELIDALLKDETKATRLLQTARAHDLSFGLAYNHVDDDIAQLIGRLRYMLFLAQRHSPPNRASEPVASAIEPLNSRSAPTACLACSPSSSTRQWCH